MGALEDFFENSCLQMPLQDSALGLFSQSKVPGATVASWLPNDPDSDFPFAGYCAHAPIQDRLRQIENQLSNAKAQPQAQDIGQLRNLGVPCSRASVIAG
eukprot:1732851-Amphidinium_carterae.1